MANVFDQVAQEAAQQAVPQGPSEAAAQAVGQGQPQSNIFDQVAQEDAQAAQQQQTPGEQVNDVGNKVIVPKEGESFADTMKRAAAYGKTVTPEQINRETATMPAKVAQTVVAAPVIGAAGTAGLAAPAEIPAAAEKILQLSETALEHLAENYPQLTKLASKLGYGVGAAGAYKLLNKLGIH